MWDDGHCDPCYDGPGYDFCYDGGYYDCCPCYPAFGFVAPIGGYYNQPYVVREEVIHRYPNQQQQPQVVVINNKNKNKKPEEVEYMMVDPTDKEGKRLIKVDPKKVKEGAFVVDNPPAATRSSNSGPELPRQRPAPQTQPNQAPKKKTKKKASCRCC